MKRRSARARYSITEKGSIKLLNGLNPENFSARKTTGKIISARKSSCRVGGVLASKCRSLTEGCKSSVSICMVRITMQEIRLKYNR
jgi:hypothetical protein